MMPSPTYGRRRVPTPWGLSDAGPRELAPGIEIYSTPSHGGIHLSPERMRELPARLHKRSAKYCPMDWFEEDCEISLVIAGFPQYFTLEQVDQAERMIASYYPEQARELAQQPAADA